MYGMGVMDVNWMVELMQSVLGIVIALSWYILTAISLMTIAKKTNTDNGWFAWIPILNFVLLIQIARQPLWLLLFYLLGCTAPFVYAYNWYGVAEQRGKSGILIAILTFVPIVNLLVPLYVAFSD